MLLFHIMETRMNKSHEQRSLKKHPKIIICQIGNGTPFFGCQIWMMETILNGNIVGLFFRKNSETFLWMFVSRHNLYI